MDPFQNHPQVPQRPRPSGCSTVMLVLVVLVLVAGGGGLAFYSQSHHLSLSAEPQFDNVDSNGQVTNAEVAPTVDAWNGSSTFECTGADHVTIAGKTIVATASPALRATGACELSLVGVTLTAPVAIEATGGSHVSITGGAITGSVSSIVASGGAHVDVTGATVTGPVQRSGGAVITGVDRK